MGTETGTRANRGDLPAPDHEVVVIGAGPGGIAAGVKLLEAGIRDFAVLERADDVGGSWRDNRYPGIGVDIPSIAYQYSFAKNARWSRFFAKGDEVYRYHRDVAERFGVLGHCRFGVSVEREVWDEAAGVWRLHLAGGGEVTARFVISAVGAFLNQKLDPGIPGWQDFEGDIQRPVGWDWDVPLAGRRVAVVGTGASAVQIVPSIAPECGELTVYQRTPVWCLPKPDFEMRPWMQRLLGLPGVAAALHGLMLAGAELLLRLVTELPPRIVQPAMSAFDRSASVGYASYLRRVVADPATAGALRPTHGMWAKRPTLSNAFLRAFNRPDVRLVTQAIDRITPTGVVTADGEEHPADVLVLATGYEMFTDPEAYRPGTIVGRDGFDLGRFYAAEGLQAYESVAVPGLPNRWMLVGPYSWTGSGWHALVEITSTHAVRAIAEARRRRATVMEVRPEVHAEYHRRLRERGRNIDWYYTVLNAGVRTYYVNSQGHTPYIRPSSFVEARRSCRNFPFEHYRFERESSGTGSPVAAEVTSVPS